MSDISIVVTSNTSSIVVTAPAGAGATINTGVISAPPTTNAADLTSGTLPDARLSAAVPILVSGLIPSGLLPSYVDDVVEYANLAGFPATGEAGKIFVDIATKKIYRWSGSVYVEINAAPVQSVSGRTGAVTLTNADVGLGSVNNTSDAAKEISTATQSALNLKAPLVSPALTSIPTAPTASVDTSTTQLATCAFVVGQAGNTPPAMDAVAYIGTSLRYARQDHVHASDTTRAAIASPTFTGTVTIPIGASIYGYAQFASPTFTGTPAAPTASVDTSTTQLATCQFVVGQASNATPVMDGAAAIGTSLRYARQDHVHPTDTSLATLNSPALTGTPTAPTASAATNTTQIATTAFVRAEVAALVGTAAATLDTLGELADALGSDASFSTTIAASIGLKAPIESPTFTGTVTIPSGASISGFAPVDSPTFTTAAYAPTASADDTTTKIATCQFVTGQAGSNNPTMNSSAGVGTSLRYSREDHTHPSDTSLAASSHTHGNITNAGAIGSTTGLPVITTASGVLTTGTFGYASGQFAQGNDYRIIDGSQIASTATYGRVRLADTLAGRTGTDTSLAVTPSSVYYSSRAAGRARFWECFNDFVFDFSGGITSDGFCLHTLTSSGTAALYLSRFSTVPFGITCTTASGSTSVTTATTARLRAGMLLTGASIGSDCTITTVMSGTSFYISSAATFAATGATLTFTQPGVGLLELTTGSSSTGYAMVYSYQSEMPRMNDGTRLYECMVQVPLLSDATQEFLCRIGMHDGSTTMSNGIYFEYNQSLNGDYWTFCSTNNASTTRTSPTVPVAAGAWIKLGFRSTVSGSTITLYPSFNGYEFGSIATNIRPDGAMKLAASIIKSVGTTSRSFLVDYVYMRHEWIGSR